MWGVLTFVVLFPLFGALFWMLAVGTGGATPPSTTDIFLWIAYFYIGLIPNALVLGVVEFLTRRWPRGLVCSVLLAFVLVPSGMWLLLLFALFDGQRVGLGDLPTPLKFGLIGAGAAVISGVIGRYVQTIVIRRNSFAGKV